MPCEENLTKDADDFFRFFDSSPGSRRKEKSSARLCAKESSVGRRTEARLLPFARNFFVLRTAVCPRHRAMAVRGCLG